MPEIRCVTIAACRVRGAERRDRVVPVEVGSPDVSAAVLLRVFSDGGGALGMVHCGKAHIDYACEGHRNCYIGGQSS